jgi:hypothetical protein
MTVNLNNNSKTKKSLNISTSLSFLQINLRHSKAASAVLLKTMDGHNIDIVMAQEPSAVKVNDNILFNAPGGFIAHHKLSEDHRYGAAILVKNSIPSQPVRKRPLD